MSSPTPKAYGDIREEALKTFQKAYGVSALYTDYREMLEREKLDLVVSSPTAKRLMDFDTGTSTPCVDYRCR